MDNDKAYSRWAAAAKLAREAEEFFHRARSIIQELDLNVELAQVSHALYGLATDLRTLVPRPVYLPRDENQDE